jgi:hypothetical protein
MMETEDVTRLQSLIRQGTLSVVPAGSSDDAYILAFARRAGGFIVSNDHFDDHLRGVESETVQGLMKVYLAQHRCAFSFVGATFFLDPTCCLSLLLESVAPSDFPPLFSPVSSAERARAVSFLSGLNSCLAIVSEGREGSAPLAFVPHSNTSGRVLPSLLHSSGLHTPLLHVLLARAHVLLELGDNEAASRDLRAALHLVKRPSLLPLQQITLMILPVTFSHTRTLTMWRRLIFFARLLECEVARAARSEDLPV